MSQLKTFMSKYTDHDYSVMDVAKNIYFVYDCEFKNIDDDIKRNCNCAFIDFSESEEGEIIFYERLDNVRTIYSYKHYQVWVAQ